MTAAPSRDYESGSVTLPSYGPLMLLTAEQVFAKGCPPLIASASSKSGKTVMCVDMVYSCRDTATGFTYVTNSYHTPENTYLRQMIPEIHVKNWDAAMLCSLWEDILQRSHTIETSISERAVDQFISTHCGSNPILLADLRLIDQVVRDNAGLFPDVTAGERAAAAHRLAAKLSFIRNHYSSSDSSLTGEARAVVAAASSSKPCHILILDDVTAQLRSPAGDIMEVPYLTESGAIERKTMKGAKGMEYLLINLLTVARHYAVVGFFVHTFDCFPPSVRSQFGAMMFLGVDAVEQISRERTVSAHDIELIRGAWSVAAKYQYHKVVLFPNPDITSHGQRVALYKATYHTQPLPIGVPTYQAVMRNIASAMSRYRADSANRSSVEAEQRRLRDVGIALAHEGARLATAPTTFGGPEAANAAPQIDFAAALDMPMTQPIAISLPPLAPAAPASDQLDSLLG